MGAFAREFKIRPWEWDLLTVQETRDLVAQIDELYAPSSHVPDEPGVERSSINFGGSGYGYR